MWLKEMQLDNTLGWTIKRARDINLSSPTTISDKLSCNDSTQVVVSKEYLLKLIDRLGKDELQKPGKFHVYPFFSNW